MRDPIPVRPVPPLTPPEFQLSLRFGEAAVVAITGELDLSTVPDLAAVLEALVSRGHRIISVDCRDLQFIDASGLRALIAVRVRLAGAEGEVRVHGLSDFAYRLFEIAGLVELFHAQRRDADRGGDDPDRIAAQVSDLLIDAALVTPGSSVGGDGQVAPEAEVDIRDAIQSRVIIAMAQGALIERFGVDADTAFDMLRRDSMASSVPLRQKAGEILEQTQPPSAVTDSRSTYA